MRFEVRPVSDKGALKYFFVAFDRAGGFLFGSHATYDRPSKAVKAIKALVEQSKRAHIVVN